MSEKSGFILYPFPYGLGYISFINIDIVFMSFYNNNMNLYKEVVTAIKIVQNDREDFLARSLAHEDLIKIKKLLDEQLKDSVLAMEKNET